MPKIKFTIEEFDSMMDEVWAKYNGVTTEKPANPILAGLKNAIEKRRGERTEPLNLEDLMRK